MLPRPMSTSVPTMVRTMWRRNPVPLDLESQQSSVAVGRAIQWRQRERLIGVDVHLDDVRRQHAPDRRLHVGAAALERGEVVLADERRRRALHAIEIERLRHVPDHVTEERARRARRSRSHSDRSLIFAKMRASQRSGISSIERMRMSPAFSRALRARSNSSPRSDDRS